MRFWLPDGLFVVRNACVENGEGEVVRCGADPEAVDWVVLHIVDNGAVVFPCAGRFDGFLAFCKVSFNIPI